MKLLRYLLPFVFAISLVSTSSYALDGDRLHEEELNERDYDALRQFVNSKRTLDLQEKSCNLTISGDVRTSWRHLTEQCNGLRLLGNRNFLEPGQDVFPDNCFGIGFNLRFDYISDNAWGVAHIFYGCNPGVDGSRYKGFKKEKIRDYIHKVDCSQPTTAVFAENTELQGSVLSPEKKTSSDIYGWHGSGDRGNYNFRKAYWGINLYDNCGARFDVEVGRRNLYNVFDSKVQFLSRFDGILFKYRNFYEKMAEFYAYFGAFVVDERVDHFAWITEIGAENICESCFDVKYSFIDWSKFRVNIRGEEKKKVIGFRFLNSQFTTAYHFNPGIINVKSKAYGAVVVNHTPAKLTVHEVVDRIGTKPIFGKTYHFNNERYAWYVGCTFGKVCEQGDWALDMQYQYVQAVAIPDRDVSGIGRGNCLGQSFTAEGRGNTNYKGWRAELLYALTDNLTMDVVWEASTAINKRIGGAHDFTKFEIEAIFAF